MASKESAKGLLMWQTLKRSNLPQLDRVLYKWFTAMSSEGKPVNGLMAAEKVKSFYIKWK